MRTYPLYTVFSAAVRLLLLCIMVSGAGCTPTQTRMQKISLFIGIDVSGSFYNSPYYDNAIEFASVYIYAHLNGLGDLKQPRALFVGSIGGDTADDPKAFHPIHDFRDKSVEEIEKNLRGWFPQSNLFTDFNVFFEKVATITKRENLVLAPLEVVMISDGVPDISTRIKSEKKRYTQVSLKPLEYLARSVTIRLLYSSSKVGDHWRKLVKRKRVKIFTGDVEVMVGWKNQMVTGVPIEKQEKVLIWIKDNVDLRVPRFY